MGWSSSTGWQGDGRHGWSLPVVSGTPPGTAWDPSQLGSQLVFWFDPSQGVTVTGSNVSAWADRKSGLALGPASGSAGPTVSTLNGKPALLFAASTNQALFAQGQSFSYTNFSTLYAGTIKSGGNYPIALAFGKQGGAGAGNNADTLIALIGSAGNAILYAEHNTKDTANVTVGFDTPFTSLTALDGTNLSQSINAAAASTVAAAGPISSTAVVVGGNASNGVGGTSNPWGGLAGAFVATSGVLTQSQTDKLNGWAAWLVGAQGSLPSGHPYKVRAPLVGDA